MEGLKDPNVGLDERLRILYPMVNEAETPLPRTWSSSDKYNFISLTNGNLRVQYKGHGKTHKDASSVRATHPIPASCGIFYFEVRIISKGRDGYMGVGLSAQGVSMNRLPGWDKHSYGYHGDDGHSFCSSGTGQTYGPTFTTGDVIGCGINLMEGTCFYTKNGINLGTAFRDLPAGLYPTVGLQTPGEVVDANFGHEPFVFDIAGEMTEQRSKVRTAIENFPVPGRHGDWQTSIHNLVSTYLVHHGYSSTAEAFNRATRQELEEELESVQKRQAVQKLVLDGKMGEALQMLKEFYPDLFGRQPELLFRLKVRQFIEIVSGCDSVYNVQQHHHSLQQQQHLYHHQQHLRPDPNANVSEDVEMVTNGNDAATNGNSIGDAGVGVAADPDDEDASCSSSKHSGVGGAGDSSSAGAGAAVGDDDGSDDTMMDVDAGVVAGGGGGDAGVRPGPIAEDPVRLDKLISFGQSLQEMLAGEVKTRENEQMLQDAFSLLAYSEPRSSPVGWQLEQDQREAVSSELNSAILKTLKLSPEAPLEIDVVHIQSLLKSMSQNDLGCCAFANVDEYFK